MSARLVKRWCVSVGCAETVPKKEGEYCKKHRCTAFSVSYGECTCGSSHEGKHMNAEGDEWG